MSEPEPPKTETAPRVHWTAGGIALFAIGLLIAIPSGLCTMVLGLPIMFSTPNDLPMVLLFGGLPFVIGFALILIGLNLRRRD